MSLDYTPLGNAIAQLEKSLAYASSPAAMADPGLREQMRNSVIQCFEFTYRGVGVWLARQAQRQTIFGPRFGAHHPAAFVAGSVGHHHRRVRHLGPADPG